MFQLSPSSRSRHRLCCRTATSTQFWSSTKYTSFHYILYISQRSNAKNCFRITGLQHLGLQRHDLEPSADNALLSLEINHRVCQIQKEGGVVNRFLTARRHFLTPWSEGTHCMENEQPFFFSLASHALRACKARARRAQDSYATLYWFLYWFWEKKRLFCSLRKK